MKYSCLFLLSLFLLGKITAQTPAQTLPNFTFFRLDNNQPFTEKNVAKNKKLFLIFFDPECEHCQHVIENFGKQYQSLKKAAVYLISMEDPNKVKRFMETYGKNLKNQPNLIVLKDANRAFLPRFKPRKYPSMFLFSPDKKLIYYSDEEASIPTFFKAINEK